MAKTKRKEDSGVERSIFTALVSFALGILAALFVPYLLNQFSITEPRLMHAGPPPITPSLQVKSENDRHVFHVKTAIRVKNHGFRRGHVEKVEVRRDGILEHPESVYVLHFDKTDIGWNEERAVGIEFIVLLDPRNLRYDGTKTERSFWTYYYGQDGAEIYAEKLVLTHWFQRADERAET
jgi:hypothetical protein